MSTSRWWPRRWAASRAAVDSSDPRPDRGRSGAHRDRRGTQGIEGQRRAHPVPARPGRPRTRRHRTRPAPRRVDGTAGPRQDDAVARQSERPRHRRSTRRSTPSGPRRGCAIRTTKTRACRGRRRRPRSTTTTALWRSASTTRWSRWGAASWNPVSWASTTGYRPRSSSAPPCRTWKAAPGSASPVAAPSSRSATSSAWPRAPTITWRCSTRPPDRRWTCFAPAGWRRRRSGSCSSPATAAAPSPAAPWAPTAAKSITRLATGPRTDKPTSMSSVWRVGPITAWSVPAAGTTRINADNDVEWIPPPAPGHRASPRQRLPSPRTAPPSPRQPGAQQPGSDSSLSLAPGVNVAGTLIHPLMMPIVG